MSRVFQSRNGHTALLGTLLKCGLRVSGSRWGLMVCIFISSLRIPRLLVHRDTRNSEDRSTDLTFGTLHPYRPLHHTVTTPLRMEVHVYGLQMYPKGLKDCPEHNRCSGSICQMHD